MKHAFINRSFRADSMSKIETANEIIDSYTTQGLRLTLRQLYYQFVARHGLENTERSYKNLASLISDARLAGLIDWNAIEDRGRVPEKASEFSGIPQLVRAAVQSYRLDRWIGQECYAELWVEKQALAGVLWPLAYEFHVTLMVNKGYSSQSAMFEAAQRFTISARKHRRHVLFYLGDHDPSGEDMVRDIAERLEMFGATLEVTKLALTMDQVEDYKPPPNPAKRTDARFASYSAKHGDESWEVDALDPPTLTTIIREAFESIVDKEALAKIIARENSDKKKLEKALRGIDWEAEDGK